MMNSQKKIGWVSLVLTGLLGMAGCSSEEERPLESPVRFEGSIFGSFYQISIADPLTQGELSDIEEGFLAELQSVDRAMSTYRDDSELVAFNQAPVGEWQLLSPEIIEVMAISQSVSEASQGALDVTVGGLVNLWSFGPEAQPEEIPDDQTLEARLETVGFDALEFDADANQAQRTRDVFVDLSAVAKGYAADQVADYLNQQGFEHYLVNLGGDLVAQGYRDREEETPWRIGIEVPEDGPQTAQLVLPLSNMTVATSGDYRNYFEQDGQRFSHTIDPRTGRPITHGLASVSVFDDSNARADAWATALMVAGEQEGMAIAQANDLDILMLVRDGEQWKSLASPGFAATFGETLLDELTIEVVQATPDTPTEE
ncbi:MAG: FAD:protein FMN transferase [Pseudomonadota bacterium]